MSRLINADSAIERVKAQGEEHPNAYPLTHYAELILSEAPTVDAVEVVRCANCRWANREKQGVYCSRLDMSMWNHDYCSYGEK